MKKLFILLIFVVSVPAFTQSGSWKEIISTDPLYGEWQVIGDGGYPAILNDQECTLFSLTGNEKMFCAGYDQENNVILPVYFKAMVNGKTLKGTITVAMEDGLHGKTFMLDYTYDSKKDQLSFLQEGTTYVYTRVKK